MDRAEIIKWIRTAGLSAVGGGIAGAFAAAMDPTKYNLAHDVGSGKLWKFAGMGALLTLGGMLLRSPLGQSAMSAYKDAQTQLDQAKKDIDKAKESLKPPTGPPGK